MNRSTRRASRRRQARDSTWLPSEPAAQGVFEEAPEIEDLGSVVRSAALLAVSRPDLYRANAFRITGLPVTVTVREVERHADRLRLAERLGTPLQVERLLPLGQAPDAEFLREAHQRLRDPERRLVDELFWLWPLAGTEPDEALACLARGEIDGAIGIWRALEGGEASVVAQHNLVVLWHSLALEVELEAMSGTSAPLHQNQRDLYWPLALEGWARLVAQEPLWQRMRTRVRELDDPRLTVETVTELRDTLPIVVLAILSELATRSASTGDLADSRRLARLIDSSGFHPSAVREAKTRSAMPLRNRISALCESAEREADVDPHHADGVTEQLATQTGPLLDALDELLAAQHPTRETSHDQVALRLLECLVSYGNSVENWQRSLELMRPVLRVAASATARERIQHNLEIVENNFAGDLSNRIVELCRGAAAKAATDPRHADRFAEHLLEQVQSLLETLDSSVADGNLMRAAAHDAVAAQVLECHIHYCNETKDWKRSIAPLRQALAVAVSTEARQHIQESLEALDRNLVAGQCFFCADSGPYQHDDLEITFHRVISTKQASRGLLTVETENGSLKVPRCRTCKRAHGWPKKATSLGMVLGALAGMVACARVSDDGCGAFLLLLLLIAVGAGIGKLIGAVVRPNGVKPMAAAREYAPLRGLLTAGWSLGTDLSQ